MDYSSISLPITRKQSKEEQIDYVIELIKYHFDIGLHYMRADFINDPKFAFKIETKNDGHIQWYEAEIERTLFKPLYFDSRKERIATIVF